jgi:ABC-type glycerol-3-phosphate transport system permease component
MATRKRNRYLPKILFWIVIGIVLIWTLFPIYYIAATSLKRPSDWYTPGPPTAISLSSWTWEFGYPADPELVAYGGAIEVTHYEAKPVYYYIMNSAIIGAATAGLSVAIAAISAYALARFRFKGRMTIAYWILGLRALPPIAVILPYFVLFVRLNLVDTHIGMVIVYTVINLPLAVWLLMSYMEDIPKEIEEAALVDGASRWTAFRTIILPLSMPGIIAVAIFALITSWNEFLFAYVLTRSNAITLPILISSFIAHRGVLWGPMAVVAVLAIIPVYVFTMIVHRHLVRIMTLGAVKG